MEPPSSLNLNRIKQCKITPTTFEQWQWQVFSKYISKLIFRRYELYPKKLLSNPFSNKVMINFSVLGTSMKHWI